MKKFAKTIYQTVVATAMAFMGAIVCIQFEIGYWAAPIVAFVLGGLLGALITGVFSSAHKSESNNTIQYDGRLNYGQAAVFLGTAAIFIGTHKECEEMCQDLWHYAQQVRVDTITGDEAFEVL